MIPQKVIDGIHDDIDDIIEGIPSEIRHMISPYVKYKLDYEHDVDFLYGMAIGKVWRKFSMLMVFEQKRQATQAELVEFSELLYKRALEIKEAIDYAINENN